MPPAQLEFRSGPNGKPDLAASRGRPALRFNLSHAQDLALYAVTLRREVGVDVERVSHDFVDLRLAERFFCPREVLALRAVSGDQGEAFSRCWTLKEAFLKAMGEGLAFGLDRFDVSAALESPAVLPSPAGWSRGAPRWSVQQLAPGPGYVAALAIEGVAGRVECWQWPE